MHLVEEREKEKKKEKNGNGASAAEHKWMMLRADKTFPDTTLLERLPGAQRLGPDEVPFAGCSALVAVDESEVPLAARIVQVWDSAYVHVDYSVHGISRLDEVVDTGRLIVVVKFCKRTESSSKNAVPSPKERHIPQDSTSIESVSNGGPHVVPQDQRSIEEVEWKALEAEFKKTRTCHVLDQKQQELLRRQEMLMKQKQQIEQAVHLQFTVDEDLLGLSLGTKGSNLWRARQLPGVFSIEIEGNQVRVVAENDEAAEAARDAVEFLRESVPIQPSEARLLIGRGGKNIKDLQAKCQGLFSINVGDQEIDLVGSRKAIKMAKRGIQVVSRFLSEQESLWQDTRGLLQEVRSISIPFGLLQCEEDAFRDASNGKASSKREREREREEEMPTYEMLVPSDKVGLVIGIKGANIREISEKTRCLIIVHDKGTLVTSGLIHW
jgi:transcription antitermination factor NusA-like protein